MSETLRQEAVPPRGPIGYWLAWLTLVCTLIPAHPRWGEGPMRWRLRWDWGGFAVSLLLCAALIRLAGTGREPDDGRTPQSARLVRAAWWCAIVATWAIFWEKDLCHAQFRVTLLSIPAATLIALASGLVSQGRRFLSERASWSGAVAVGTASGLGLVCAMMAPRGQNGCTGVSTAYHRTQCITLIALYLLGPAMLAPCFSACFARPGWLHRRARAE